MAKSSCPEGIKNALECVNARNYGDCDRELPCIYLEKMISACKIEVGDSCSCMSMRSIGACEGKCSGTLRRANNIEKKKAAVNGGVA